MRGLEEYIRKHGKHFTDKLAIKVTNRRWDPCKVAKAAQDKVYYNVTQSTVGDMVYLLDMVHERLYPLGQYTNNRGINGMLAWVGDYKKTESAFNIWLTTVIVQKQDFDFTPYI